MRLAVSGASGFVGRHFVSRCLARGHEVRVLTRRASATFHPEALVFHGDIMKDIPAGWLDDVDVLIHCAAELRDGSRIWTVNRDGTARLMKAAEGRVRRWVQLSSAGVYGMRRSGTVNELSPVAPSGPYEQSKLAADRLLVEFSGHGEPDLVIVRPTTVIGFDMPNDSFKQLVRAIMSGRFRHIGNGNAIANYVHVDDVAEALLLAASSGLPDGRSAAPSRTYIVSDDMPLRELVDLVEAAAGISRPAGSIPEWTARAAAWTLGRIPGFPLTVSRVDALTRSVRFSSERIRAELGFVPGVGVRAAVLEAVGGIVRP